MDFELLLIALAYGVGMKTADLLNEHRLPKWFWKADIIFGLIWGTAGALLVCLGHNDLANVLLAMVAACIVRLRVDYLNHALAAVIIIFAFIATATPDWWVLAPAFAIFAIFGSLKDHRGVLRGNWRWLGEVMLYYSIPLGGYGLATGNWEPFWVMLAYTIAYDITKAIGRRSPHYREQPL